jgi:hypothetical protein
MLIGLCGGKTLLQRPAQLLTKHRHLRGQVLDRFLPR